MLLYFQKSRDGVTVPPWSRKGFRKKDIGWAMYVTIANLVSERRLGYACYGC